MHKCQTASKNPGTRVHPTTSNADAGADTAADARTDTNAPANTNARADTNARAEPDADWVLPADELRELLRARGILPRR
jgi:hypothetical protein